MNKKKIEVLKQLKEKIKTEGATKYAYIEKDTEGNNCYCAVGHLMNICGVEMEKTVLPYDSLNGVDVCGTNEDGHKIRELLVPVLDTGFTLNELSVIQNMNDAEEMLDLLRYIDEMLQEVGQ